jgi:hypothetical protein
MPVAPLAQFAELLHLRVHVLLVVLDGQASGVVDAHIAAKAEQDSCGFEGKKPGV